MGQTLQHPCLDFGTPMQVLITEHRRILDAIEASPPFDGDCEELVALDNAEWDALKAVIAAPCNNRADALAVLQHFRPYVAAQGNAFGGALRATSVRSPVQWRRRSCGRWRWRWGRTRRGRVCA